MKTAQQEILKKVSQQETIEFVSEGIAAEATGYIFSEDAAINIAEALEKAATTSAEVTRLQGELDTANAAKKTAEDSLAAANTKVTELEGEKTTMQARIEELEEDGTTTSTSKQEDKLSREKTPFHLSKENPMNKFADSLMGEPKAENK